MTGLVGPNGAGKTTLLHLAVGLIAPTSGTISVLGQRPASSPGQLGRVGFVAQDAPVYSRLSVADHLRFGAWLNPGWDGELARRRIEQVGLDPRQRAGSLSGGERAQLALTLAMAKRPELLILDEPVASLDPLARREFLQGLMEAVAEQGVSVVLSSHLVADLERVCDYLVVLVASRVQVTGEVSAYLPNRRRQKAGLNRGILGSCWGLLATRTEQKAVASGAAVMYVDPKYSSQQCRRCSHVATENRESQAVFRCVACGHEDHADANAAKNVLARGLAFLDIPAQAPGPRGIRPQKTPVNPGATGTTRDAA